MLGLRADAASWPAATLCCALQRRRRRVHGGDPHRGGRPPASQVPGDCGGGLGCCGCWTCSEVLLHDCTAAACAAHLLRPAMHPRLQYRTRPVARQCERREPNLRLHWACRATLCWTAPMPSSSGWTSTLTQYRVRCAAAAPVVLPRGSAACAGAAQSSAGPANYLGSVFVPRYASTHRRATCPDPLPGHVPRPPSRSQRTTFGWGSQTTCS